MSTKPRRKRNGAARAECPRSRFAISQALPRDLFKALAIERIRLEKPRKQIVAAFLQHCMALPEGERERIVNHGPKMEDGE